MTKITHNGETMTLREWAIKTGINLQTLRNRRSRGLSPAEILAPVLSQSARLKKARDNSPWRFGKWSLKYRARGKDRLRGLG